jgi:hypothetical protein
MFAKERDVDYGNVFAGELNAHVRTNFYKRKRELSGYCEKKRRSPFFLDMHKFSSGYSFSKLWENNDLFRLVVTRKLGIRVQDWLTCRTKVSKGRAFTYRKICLQASFSGLSYLLGNQLKVKCLEGAKVL